jgi:hypothetical protein
MYIHPSATEASCISRKGAGDERIKRLGNRKKGRGNHLLSAAQICLVAAAILGLNACVGRRQTAPSSPTTTSASPAPQPTITSAASSQPARAAVAEPSVTTPARQAANKKADSPVAKTPAPVAQASKPSAPPSASPTLDLNGLKKQLKETKAIGLFTKIALKNQVDDLLNQFRKYYQGKSKIDMMELRRSYNLLLMKVLSLLQNKDQKLASAIVSSREAIWGLLSDPKKFANLEI